MTDTVLLDQAGQTFAQMTRFDREVYAHARLRLLAGVPLKPAQRRHLLRLLALTLRRKEVSRG